MKVKEFMAELADKDLQQLEQQLQESRKALAELKIRHRLNRLKDYKKIKQSKKMIARIMTIINHKRKEELHGS